MSPYCFCKLFSLCLINDKKKLYIYSYSVATYLYHVILREQNRNMMRENNN